MEEINVLLLFDVVLGLTLVWLAWQTLSSLDLFRAIVLFIAFGLLMALAWVRLDAPDVALAEATIGAGLTGALLLSALAQLSASQKNETKPSLFIRLTLGVLLFFLVIALAYTVLSLPTKAVGLSVEVAKNIELSGVSNPVTAVLLNYRSYDTLLELGVLLLALLGVWSLGGVSTNKSSFVNPVLDLVTRLLVPIFILFSGYLLWVGAFAPGGAFQAGAVLAAAGVLVFLSDWYLPSKYSGFALRLVLVIGLLWFVSMGFSFVLLDNAFLEYPPEFAGGLILLIEAAATLSIGISLAALFLGREPATKSDSNIDIDTGVNK